MEDKKDTSKPVLLLLLQDKLNNKDISRNNQVHKLDRYDFNNYNKSEGELSNSENNKNQLNPSSFGSTNKSLDMTEPANINKFNTFNMNEVYKIENKPITGSLIEEDDKNNKGNSSEKNESVNNDISNNGKESDETSNIKENEKMVEINEKDNAENSNNIDEFQEAINEEINGKDMKDESKNVESQSSHAFQSTASNNKK